MSDNAIPIAKALAVLADDALDILHMQFVILDAPLPIREAIWEAVARSATQNAEDCRETEG